MSFDRLNKAMRIDYVFDHVERGDHVRVNFIRRGIERSVDHREIFLAREARARCARLESLPGPVTGKTRKENSIAATDVENRSPVSVRFQEPFELTIELYVAWIVRLRVEVRGVNTFVRVSQRVFVLPCVAGP